jgi:TonB family protein
MTFRLLLAFLIISTSICQAQQEKKNIVFKVRKAAIKDVVKIESNNYDIVTSEDVSFTIVEEPASFQGGSVDDFRNWVQSKILYPPSAIEAELSGKVTVQFSVDPKGKVGDMRIIRGISKDIDNEVLRVISSSPTWAPGKQGGKAVKQVFVIPVAFIIE